MAVFRTSFHFHRNELCNPRLFHRNPIEQVGFFHRPFIVRDDQELGVVRHPPQDTEETAAIFLVEGRVDFVKNTERARVDQETREQKGYCRERFFASG